MAKLHLQTGPVRAEGKQVSRRNATTRGGTSSTASGPTRPEEVYRKFEFSQGMPPEYHCFTDREDSHLERGHTIEQWISLDNWREPRRPRGSARNRPRPAPLRRFVS